MGEVVPETSGSFGFYKLTFVIYERPEAAQQGARLHGFMSYLGERRITRQMANNVSVEI